MTSNSFDIFIIHCVFTNAILGDDFINYKFDKTFTPADYVFPLRVADRVIQENELPLEAKIIKSPFKYILQITEK